MGRFMRYGSIEPGYLDFYRRGLPSVMGERRRSIDDNTIRSGTSFARGYRLMPMAVDLPIGP